MIDPPDQAACSEGAGRLPFLEHCRLVAALDGAQPLAGFLDPGNLSRRGGAVAAHLARMPGDRRLVDHTSWALGALNVLGWILVPTVALSAAGVRSRDGWAACLGCLATDEVGPFALLVRVDGIAAGRAVVAEHAAVPEDLVELARELMTALHRAGCPVAEARSAAAGALGTLARQAGAASPEERLARAVWRRLVPGASSAPGDPGFRRPSCCGLMALARTDAACCPDCPRR